MNTYVFTVKITYQSIEDDPDAAFDHLAALMAPDLDESEHVTDWVLDEDFHEFRLKRNERQNRNRARKRLERELRTRAAQKGDA